MATPVSVTRWLCARKHTHLTEAAANKCEKMRPLSEYRSELAALARTRGAIAFELRRQGYTLKAIGEHIGGVSVERARQIYVREWRQRLREGTLTEIDHA